MVIVPQVKESFLTSKVTPEENHKHSLCDRDKNERKQH